jgi:hypothetical protein
MSIRKCCLIVIPITVLLTAVGIWLFANHRAQNIVDERIAGALASGAYDSITYGNLNILPNGDIEMQDLMIVADGFSYTLEDIRVRDLDYQHEQPWHLEVEVNGIAFPDGLPDIGDSGNPAADEFLRSLVADDRLPLNLVYSYHYDPKQQDQIDSTARLMLPQSFVLDVSSITRNIPLSLLAGNGALPADPGTTANPLGNMAPEAALVSARFSLDDQGLVETMMAIMARRSGVEPADFRNFLVTQSRNLYLFAPQDAQALAMEVGSQVANFLEGDRSLSISVNPQLDGNIQQLQAEIMGAAFTGNFGGIADLLNLQVLTE